MSLAVQQSPWLAHLMDLRVEKALLIYRDGSEPPTELVVNYFNACFDVVFDQAPELIKLPSDTCYAGINTPNSPRSPFAEFKSPLESPGFVLNHGLLSPPPSIEALASDKPVTPSSDPGITKSRPARILSRLLGRARGNATLTMEMGQVSLSETEASTPKSDHIEKVFESVDASRLEVTVRFGDKAGILGEDSVDVKLNISPLSVDVLRAMALQEKLKHRIPRQPGPKRDRTAREARMKVSNLVKNVGYHRGRFIASYLPGLSQCASLGTIGTALHYRPFRAGTGSSHRKARYCVWPFRSRRERVLRGYPIRKPRVEFPPERRLRSQSTARGIHSCRSLFVFYSRYLGNMAAGSGSFQNSSRYRESRAGRSDDLEATSVEAK